MYPNIISDKKNFIINSLPRPVLKDKIIVHNFQLCVSLNIWIYTKTVLLVYIYGDAQK